MPAKIVVIEGSALGSIYPLENRIIFEVGNSGDCDIHLNDPDIVAVHLKIYRENKDFHIFDLSGRGFLINGRRSLKHALVNGDIVAIGNHALRFELEEEADASKPQRTRHDGDSADGADGDQLESDRDEEIVLRSKADLSPDDEGAIVGEDNGDRAELQAIKGNDTGKVFDLRERPMSILGRGIATDITVWDIRVSRVHCRIDNRSNDFVVSDMNSSNGTWINGVRLKKPQKLNSGDYLKLGSTVFQFEQRN